MADESGIDLSPLHRELDRLKVRLCRCDHRGECLACRGFEILREQSQMVVAAASQPVLHQVAQEAAMRDLVSQLTGASEKLTSDTRLHELIGELMERVQEDLGGPEAMQRMFGELGGMPGFPGRPGGSGFPGFPGAGGPGGSGGPPRAPEKAPEDRPSARREIPYDDMTPEEREQRRRDASSGDPEAPGGV